SPCSVIVRRSGTDLQGRLARYRLLRGHRETRQAASLRVVGCNFIRPARPEIRDQQKYQTRDAVEHSITPRSRPRWNKALVPFIHRGNAYAPQPSQERHAPRPDIIVNESRVPTPKEQKTQHT